MRQAMRQATGGNPTTAAALASGLLLVSFLGVELALHAPTAKAIPAFAGQTGLPCAACHAGFPQLTPTGRMFKLNGYVLGKPAPTFKNFAVMFQPGYTVLGKGVPGGVSNGFNENYNFDVQQTSLFYGGALVQSIGLGAFVQATYDDDQKQIHWDNTDIRLARTATIGGKSLVYGVTFNNNPSVTDLWNTTPAWGYPFFGSELGEAPGAKPLISGAFAQTVYGVGAYADWNNLIYAEFDLYKSLPNATGDALGVGATSSGHSIDGVAPYWRVAVEKNWGRNSWEVGTFGLYASVYPTYPATGISPATDQYTDIGLDSQYQFMGQDNIVTLGATYIHEDQNLGSSFSQGLSANSHDTLDSFQVTAQELYKQTVGGTLSYFKTWGSTDTGLYAPAPISGSTKGTPNSSGITAELDYYPFNNGGPKFLPWFNVKFAVQYTYFLQFNGGNHNYDGFGRNATDNNQIFLGAWILF